MRYTLLDALLGQCLFEVNNEGTRNTLFWCVFFKYLKMHLLKDEYRTKNEVFHEGFLQLSFLRIWSHYLKKTLMENLIFCVV